MKPLTDINGVQVDFFAETDQAIALLELSTMYKDVFPLCLIKGPKNMATGKSAGRHARPYQDTKDRELAHQLQRYRNQLPSMEEGQFCMSRPILQTWLEMPAVCASHLRFVNNPRWSDAYDAVRTLLGRPAEVSDLALCFVPDGKSQNYFRSVFLDDIPPSCPAHLLVETSVDSWQAHFDLSDVVTSEEVHKIQRYLCEVHGGDINATKPSQARRFPNPTLRTIKNADLLPLDVAKILSQLPLKAPRLVVSTNWTQLPNIAELWEKYYKSHDEDASRADFCLALRLYSAGCAEDEILAGLQKMLEDHPRIKGTQYTESVLNAVKKFRAL